MYEGPDTSTPGSPQDPDPTPPPTALLDLPPDLLSNIAHRAHPTGRLVCATLVTASPPVTSARPLFHPHPPTLQLALDSFCARHAPTLTALDLSQIAFLQPLPQLLSLPAALPHLASLTVRHCPALATDPDALAQICARPSLTHLEISHCTGSVDPFNATRIHQLAAHIHQLAAAATALHSLTLHVDAATITTTDPTPLTALSSLQSLTRLCLLPARMYLPDGPPAQTMALLLSTAARLPALQSLLLHSDLEFRTGSTVAALLARLTHLTELRIAFRRAWDDDGDADSDDDDAAPVLVDAYQALGTLGARLQRLELGHTYVSGRALDACLAQLTGLKALRLHGVGLPQLPRLPSLGGMRGLRELYLQDVSHGEPGIGTLLALASTLQVLHVQVGCGPLPSLAQLTALTELSMDDGHNVPRERTEPLPLGGLRALRVLRLSNRSAQRATADEETAAATLGPLTGLTSLTLASCELEDRVLAAGWLAGMRQLQVLNVQGNERTLTQGLRAAVGLPCLREVGLSARLDQLLQRQPEELLGQVWALVDPRPPPALQRVRLHVHPREYGHSQALLGRLHTLLVKLDPFLRPWGIALVHGSRGGR